MSSMTKPTQLAGGATFVLSDIDRDARQEDAYQREGHTARTLVREPDLRIILIVMRAGARIAEHRADETASVHALSGHIRLRLAEKSVELTTGSLLVLEKGLRHDVDAIEDSAFLLTLGWKGA
jgi:quercetin dioxygenase-like cupin family protein